MTAVAFVAAAGLSLILFVSLANALTMLFARGAVKAAVEEGARSGGRSDSPVDECETRAREVVDGLLGAAMRSGVTVACTVSGDPPSVRAHAQVTLTPWWPGVPGWTFTVEASSVIEELP
jgi:hypothetical protein